MPCLNEARTLAVCIRKAHAFRGRSGIAGEIVVADNGSTDSSQEVAQALGARVVAVAARGYGNALRGGIEAAHGTYVIMGDSDDSYDFSALDPFVAQLRAGWDLVLGNRFRGGIRKGAMPLLHRYFGNPILTMIGRVLFGSRSGDFYCGLRGFRRDAIRGLALNSPGMEFALEMIVKATIRKLTVTEVPTTLSPDGRGRPSHLRSWRDGWRSLRFFLLLSPTGMFLAPGAALFAGGGLVSLLLLTGDKQIGGITFAEHTLVFSCSAITIGLQSMAFWLYAKQVAIDRGLLARDVGFERICARITFERGLVIGGVLAALGLLGGLGALVYWSKLSFGFVGRGWLMRLVIASGTSLLVGFQIIYSSFFMTLLHYAKTGETVARLTIEAAPDDRLVRDVADGSSSVARNQTEPSPGRAPSL
jgi:hypothetical protein